MILRQHIAAIGFSAHAVATAALLFLTATAYWQAPLWIWFMFWLRQLCTRWGNTASKSTRAAKGHATYQ